MKVSIRRALKVYNILEFVWVHNTLRTGSWVVLCRLGAGLQGLHHQIMASQRLNFQRGLGVDQLGVKIDDRILIYTITCQQ